MFCFRLRRGNKLSRTQISLGSILLVVAIVAIGMSWVRSQHAAARKQFRTVTQLRSQSALVLYDYEFDSHNPMFALDREPYSLSSEPQIPKHPPVPDPLIQWFGKDLFCGVAHIDMAKHDDALVRSVFELNDIESIGLGKVDPELVKGLSELKRIKRVQFWETVTPRQVGYAARSPAKVVAFEGRQYATFLETPKL